MKILFVSSGNTGFGISPITSSQGESLKKIGVNVEFFTITGKGVFSYLRHIPLLRKYLGENHFDLIHAHYSFSGITASLAFPKQAVLVSLMGSDVHARTYLKCVIKWFAHHYWKAIIVKSREMADILGMDCHVIPNGVDFDIFHPMDKKSARQKLALPDSKLVMFIGDPTRPEKNFTLAEKAVNLLNDSSVKLLRVYKTEPKLIPYYINAADVLILTSLWEGSPNVIKEAMACNCPIVSTDVADVKEQIGSVEGCFITGYEPQEVAQKISQALKFNRKTDGREHISHLDSRDVARQVVQVYEKVLT